MKISEHRPDHRPDEDNELESNRILNKDFFLYLLDHEVKRARRYQNFYCLLLLKVMTIVSQEEGNGVHACFKILKNLLLEGVRESDVLGSLGENRLVILLPYADVSAGGAAKSRLEKALKYYDFGSKGCQVLINQICFPYNGTDTADLIQKVLETDPLTFFEKPQN